MELNLNVLATRALATAEKRKCNGSGYSLDVASLLKHTAGEVVEAMEAYADHLTAGSASFASELADIITCVLIIARKENIDINQALLECLEKNENRAKLRGDKR